MSDVFAAADWHRAATLEERAASLRRSGPPVETDAELGARRLGRWRAQTPFQREELLGQRLAADGLGREDFVALLGEPRERLRERTAGTLPWLAELAAAFASASGAGLEPPPRPASPASLIPPAPLAAPAPLAPRAPLAPLVPLAAPAPLSAPALPAGRPLGLVAVVEPLVLRARERLLAAARQTAAGVAGASFDADSAVELFVPQLVANLERALTRTLVLELHVAARTGQLPGDTPDARLAAFQERLRQPEVALDLLRQYPVAARHAVECAERWLAFAAEVLAHLAADGAALRQELNGGEETGPLVELKAGLSDPHRGERTVLLLRFQSGLRLVYKPKPLAIDAAFQRLLVWLNERGASPAFRPLRLLDRGAYGWVEFIAAAPCASAAEVHRFYERQGGFLALFYALAATDFHCENLIAAGEHPVPIDLETLFHPRPGDVGTPAREKLAHEAIWDSVLRPGMLPERIWANDNAGVDITGFGAPPGQVTSFPVLALERGDAELLRFIRRTADLEVPTEHRPTLDGGEVDLRHHVDAIVTGFTALYRLLVRHRDDLLAPGGPLAACAAAPVRILVRPTHVYMKMLTESFHPYLLQDALDRDRLLDRLWVDVEDRPGLARIIPWEHRELERGDVPLFTALAGSRDVLTSTGERIPQALHESGLEHAGELLAQMGEADLARQLRIVHGTLETLAMQERELRWPSHPVVAAEKPAPAESFLAAARSLGDRLEAQAFRQNGSATWLGFRRMGASGFWSYEPVGSDLYAGFAGIALFLAYLGAVSGEERHTRLARAAFAGVRAQIERLSGPLTGIGGFAGWGGTVFCLLHLAALWGQPEILDLAEALVDRLPAGIEQDAALDLVSGSAGCLLALLRLHAVRPAGRTLAAAVLCGERLLGQAREMENGLGWLAAGSGPRPLTGLSHGAAGIGWALAELAAATGEARYLRACHGALAYERSLFSAAEGNWPDLRLAAADDREEEGGQFMCAWCHGAPGIGLARLACLPLVDGPELRGEIETAIATTLRRGFGGNHSLCHGDLGNLDVLLEMGRRLGRRELVDHTSRLAAGVLRGAGEHGWRSGAALAPEIPGLMTGLAGIGYQLLRLAAPDQVPSVLLLEPPR